jgi:hypothetical protein
MSVRVIADTKLSGVAKLGARIRGLAMQRVLVGIPEGRTEPGGMSTAQVGAWNEFGTATIPERPWLRTGITRNLPYFRRVNESNLRRVVDGRMSVGTALDLLGVAAAGKVKENLLAGPWAPNAPSTIAAKGSDKPLVDSGQLVNSISHQVEPA